jgi:hypothetical protein
VAGGNIIVLALAAVIGNHRVTSDNCTNMRCDMGADVCGLVVVVVVVGGGGIMVMVTDTHHFAFFIFFMEEACCMCVRPILSTQFFFVRP